MKIGNTVWRGPGTFFTNYQNGTTTKTPFPETATAGGTIAHDIQIQLNRGTGNHAEGGHGLPGRGAGVSLSRDF